MQLCFHMLIWSYWAKLAIHQDGTLNKERPLWNVSRNWSSRTHTEVSMKQCAVTGSSAKIEEGTTGT